MTAALLLAQAALTPIPEAPILSSPEFKKAVLETRRDLAAGKFDEAAKILAVLPRTRLTAVIDPAGAPQEVRPAVDAAFSDAAQVFAESAVKGSLTLSDKDPDIKISFTDVLPFIEGSKRRQAAVFFVSFEPGEPRVEAVIAMKRGLPLKPAERKDIAAEILHSVGLAMGLVRVPREGGFMGRVDAPVRFPLRMAQPEVLIARGNLEIVEALRSRIQKRIAEPVGDGPLAVLEKESFNLGTALQGGDMGTSFQVSNSGSSPLYFTLVPDCSCFTLNYDGVVAPGKTNLVRVGIDTKNFPGPLNKSIYFYSNDPDKGVSRIPFTGHVTPAFRFLRNSPESVLVIPKAGASETVYLVYPPDQPFQILGIEATGAKIKVAWTPWEGSLADPEYDEPASKRTGYAVTLQIPPRSEPGRYPVSLQIRTSSEAFPEIGHAITVQTGIVPSPSSLFLGKLNQAPASGWAAVTRPGQPFKITRVESDSSVVEGKAEEDGEGGWRVNVFYKGKGLPGRLSAMLTIHTDDPGQPKVFLPVTGTVE